MIHAFIVTILVIYGLHATTRGGMIFYKVGEFIYKRNERLAKMLFDCTPCMASIYGTISYFVYVYPTQDLFHLPVWVFSLCGTNFLINRLIR